MSSQKHSTQQLEKALLQSIQNAKEKLNKLDQYSKTSSTPTKTGPPPSPSVFTTPSFSSINTYFKQQKSESARTSQVSNSAAVSKAIVSLQQKINKLQREKAQREQMLKKATEESSQLKKRLKTQTQTLQNSKSQETKIAHQFLEAKQKIIQQERRIAQLNLLVQSKETNFKRVKQANQDLLTSKKACQIKLVQYQHKVVLLQQNLQSLQTSLQNKSSYQPDKQLLNKILLLQQECLRLKNMLDKERATAGKSTQTVGQLHQKYLSQKQAFIQVQRNKDQLLMISQKLTKKNKKLQNFASNAEHEKRIIQEKLQFYRAYTQELTLKLQKMPLSLTNPVKVLLNKISKIDSRLQQVKRDKPSRISKDENSISRSESKSRSKSKNKYSRDQLMLSASQSKLNRRVEQSEKSQKSQRSNSFNNNKIKQRLASSNKKRRTVLSELQTEKDGLLNDQIKRSQLTLSQLKKEYSASISQMQLVPAEQKQQVRRRLNELAREMQNQKQSIANLRRHKRQIEY